MDTVNKILEGYPDISAEWLLRGKGTMIISDKEENERISSLVDTIGTLNTVIKNLKEDINELKNGGK